MSVFAGFLSELSGDYRQSRKQHRIEMRIPVIFECIQQVLDMHTGFGFTFNAEVASEEEGIRILPAGGQFPEIIKVAADCHVRFVMEGRQQTAVTDTQMDAAVCVPDMQQDGFALDLAKAGRQRLSAHEVIETCGKDGGMNGIRQHPHWQF